MPARMKVQARPAPATQRTEAPRPKPAATVTAKPGRALPDAAAADGKLKGERTGDFKALAARGAELYGAQEQKTVEALCSKYGVKCSGRGEERMLMALATIDHALQVGPGIDELLSSLSEHDTRRDIFRLEALLRLYSGELPELEGALGKVKQLEDAVGAISVFTNALNAPKTKDAPPAVREQLTKSRDALVAKLKDVVGNGWAPGGKGRSDGVASIIKHLDKADFGSDSHDRKFFAKALAGHVEKVRDEHYSMKVLGDGVHALRRQLRWTVLFTEAADGTVQLGPVKHEDSAYTKVLGNKELEKLYQFVPYAPPHDGEEPIELPVELYAGLQKVVYELGVIKDDVELRESLEHAYKQAGVPKHRVDDLLGDKGTETDMEKRATAVHDQMKQEHLLKRLHHAFEDAV
jgi:hypothetical protein